MLDEVFKRLTEVLTLKAALIVVISALLLGFFISIIYMLIHKKQGYSGNYVLTLVMLPATISIIILLIGNNIASAFGLVGAFSLIRYRSAPGNPKDIAYVFFALAIGLGCGLGYVGYSVIFAIILCLVMVVLSLTNFGMNRRQMRLKITLPEDVDYQSLFNDLFDQYLKNYHFKKIKTTDFGSLYEVSYLIEFKEGINRKEFIDQIRIRNHNLNIILTEVIVED